MQSKCVCVYIILYKLKERTRLGPGGKRYICLLEILLGSIKFVGIFFVDNRANESFGSVRLVPSVVRVAKKKQFSLRKDYNYIKK